MLTVVLGSAWVTDGIGAHSIFAAFLGGVVMPRNSGVVTLGVLSPRLFAMLTCMALVTTAATGPLLRRLRLARGRPESTRESMEAQMPTTPHERTS